MSETQVNTEPRRQQPTKETFKHLRHRIKERFPAAKKVFEKSGTTPFPRQLINEAGDQLRIEMRSERDPDTGLPNKVAFLKRKAEIEKLMKDGEEIAVGVIDLDNLKVVNDTQGHFAGDKLIKDTADVIVRVSRETDVVARVGGDEFNIILLGTNPERALGWEKRIREEFVTSGIQASIGVDPVNGRDIDGSLKTADRLMYIEKRHHKIRPEGNGFLGRIKAFITRQHGGFCSPS